MIKDFNKFVKESVENKGKGVGGDTDLFPTAPKKQVTNRAIPTMDFLRVGKRILTKKIDGFIDSVQNESIFITDRITGEIKEYTLKQVLKELTSSKEDTPKSTPVEGFEGTPIWATKQKIYEAGPARKLEPEPDEEEVAVEHEQELGSEEEPEEPDLGDVEEDDVEPGNKTASFSDKVRFGTEDNPDGLPNKGMRREMPNESWVKYWEKFNENATTLVVEEEEKEEEDIKRVRGTEDNPLPVRKKTKIESYE